MDTNEAISETLSGYIKNSNDAHKYFLEAANEAKNATLKGFFRKQADVRRIFSLELTAALKVLDPEAIIDVEGSLAGALQRGWMDLKASLSFEDDTQLLRESMKMDASLKTKYQQLLTSGALTIPISTLLKKHIEVLEMQIQSAKNAEELL